MTIAVVPDARARAQAKQLLASDPAVSAFVGASAGSGKTKLLTDRLLRLMLDGADPARIQCLTFTKAAAAEMSVRLQTRLGAWVTLAEPELDAALRELAFDATPERRHAAQALFARVLDLPGGMRIGTIHAFCQSLLRRFPLEARLSPHFRLVEDADARLALGQAQEQVLTGASPATLQELAGLASAAQFAALIGVLDGVRDRLGDVLLQSGPQMRAAMRRALGVSVASEAALLESAVGWAAEPDLFEVGRLAQAHGTPAVRSRAQRIVGWLGLDPPSRVKQWEEWSEILFSSKGELFASRTFPGDKVAERYPRIMPALVAEHARVRKIEDERRALRTADISAALLALAAPILHAYAGRKRDGGMLDYQDLIGRTRELLINPGAAWVMYKLDGGMDHLLLDEVQDTAPEQWQIAHTLTEEFFAGEGAAIDARLDRTFFAVGDPKQSIYSFQGADPDEFDRSRMCMAARVGSSGQLWRDVTLDVSFRSTPPVLALVDAVFSDPEAALGVVEPGRVLQHFAARAGHAGRVELWPLAPVPDAHPAEPWTVPDRNLASVSAPQRLADQLADWIADEIRAGTMLESRGRPMAAGDVLVLVRRRGDFARALVRALKARSVPVAGLDRLVLTEQAAVQDLLALCDTLLLPQDDLSLACVLTSPLGGLTDDSLMRLAMDRPGTLWDALRDRAAEDPAWHDVSTILATLLARADHVTPYALLVEALGAMGGRARLLARLGPEAAEPVDELLNAALAYTQANPPSLQGFVHWLRRSGAEVKREAEGAGDAVRVITVHGAKGLQAPLVILPDTTALPPDDSCFAWRRDPQTGSELPLWTPLKDLRCAAVDEARLEDRVRQIKEYHRLLYVALTRAEDRLLVCGWQTRSKVPDGSWYRLVERGFLALEQESSPPGLMSEVLPFAKWPGELRVMRTPQLAALDRAEAGRAAPGEAVLPDWAGAAPSWRPAPIPREPLLPVPLAPSRPEGAAFGRVPGAVSPLAVWADAGEGLRRGRIVHELLQYLPDLPHAEREAAARAYARQPGFGLPDEAAEALVQETLRILDHPVLAPLFGPDSRAEQPLAGLVGSVVVTGVVDRIAVLPDRVLLVDYKTNRDPPADMAATPVAYVRQLAAYRAVLQAIFPERAVQCALVWTTAARVIELPDALLDAYAPGA